jgi:hypothetical protein
MAQTYHFQLTTDGYRPYVEAVEQTFESDVDFSQLDAS